MDVKRKHTAMAGVAALDLAVARAATTARRRPLLPDHGDRVGMPDSADAMRGAAWTNGFEMPPNMQLPQALRASTSGRRGAG